MICKFANENDIAGVTQLRIEYLRETYGGLKPSDESKIRESNIIYLKNALNRSCFIAFAEENRRIYSCAYLTIIEKAANLRYMSGQYGELYGVFTIPEHRNRGTAAKLVKLLVAKGQELQLPFIQLDASSSGYKLYKNIGFQDTESDYVGMKYFYNNGVK